jgi:predicted fused transcriptional regulator/phosphomethylpyrimidine kinase
VLVRFGLGVLGVDDKTRPDKEDHQEKEEHEEATDVSEGNDATVQWPCPVLEFRIVNELSGRIGGEIMNATINVAACTVDRSDEDDALVRANSTQTRKRQLSVVTQAGQQLLDTTKNTGKAILGTTKHTGKVLLGTTRATAKATGSLLQKLHHNLTKPLHHGHGEHAEAAKEEKPFNAKEMEQQIKAQLAQDLAETYGQRPSVTVDEGDQSIAPRRIYHHLHVETDSHPFFKRIWNIRHVLDEHSPLLSSVARRALQNNGGYWPEELNNHQSIRQHVHFQELVVSFGGTANVSGSSVYAQKVYAYQDLSVGYSFAPILGQDSSGALVVDHRLLNDVREQAGGGGEEISEIKQTAATSLATFRKVDAGTGPSVK